MTKKSTASLRIRLLLLLAILAVAVGARSVSLRFYKTPIVQDFDSFRHPNDVTWQQDVTRQSIEDADISVLFIGNSHTAPIPKWMDMIFASEQPNLNTLFVKAPSSGFLAGHAQNQTTLNLINKGKWDYVVLQAQKYSQSGRFHYSYDGAIALSKLASKQNTKVVMYPEWSLRGKPDEYLKINKIHQEIADQTGATVAPIGQSWTAALKRNESLALYAQDGNHASPLGSYLNASVFYTLLTQRPIEKGAKTDSMNPKTKSLFSKDNLKTLHDSAWHSVQESANDGKKE